MMANQKDKILIIEDEHDLRSAIKDVLISKYSVFCAPSSEEGLNLANKIVPDLIILDIIMPGIDGIETCKALKAQSKFKDTPIIMLTATNDDDRRANALYAGADTVISKPFKIKEFMAQIEISLKRSGAQKIKDEILTCGNLTLNSSKFEAAIDGRNIHLTVLEFKILKYFVQNLDRVISRDKLLDAIWQKDVTSRAIDNHIVSIRRKMNGAHYSLNSIYGAGYSFTRPEIVTPIQLADNYHI